MKNGMTVLSNQMPRIATNDGGINSNSPLILSAQDYYPFGMLMPERSFSSEDYRYGFNGHEKDDEVKGSGNHLSFGDYGYDPRTGRRWNVDPMSKKYPDESPYIFSGNSPISITDQDGKEKTYYLIRIAKDGTTTQLKVVEKYTVIQQTTYTRESIGVGGVTLFTSPQISNTKTFDVAQHITLDERTGKIIVGKEYTTTERSNSAIVRGIQDNAREAGNYLDEATNGGGGIVFTSEIGQGQETRKGYNADAQSENIDLLTAVLGAASSAATSKQAVGFLETFKQGVDAITIGKDVYDNTKGSSQSPTGTKKVTCGACGGDTIPASDQGSHTGPFTPVEEKKK
jgi:RHS repeat-associated protein